MKRIAKTFKNLKEQQKTAFISYVCGCDPDYETSLQILNQMPKNGVDLIEIGVPFLDPAGDGPIIEDASKRAIANGANLKKTINLVKDFRKNNDKTPIILMTYFNPLLKYGLDVVFADMKIAGADAVLIVDLPFEEEKEVLPQVKKSDLDFIRLISPATDIERSKKIAKHASGFLYLISMLGITGTKIADLEENKRNLKKLRSVSNLPIAIGFGIKTPEIANKFSKINCDGVVVGSAFVKEIENSILNKKLSLEVSDNVIHKVKEFSEAIKSD
jgi:tryptophan synthase alpha chain